MVKLQGQNEIAHASQIYFVSLYRNLEFHFLSLFPNPDPQVKTHTHAHTHTPFCFKGIMQQACVRAQSLSHV